MVIQVSTKGQMRIHIEERDGVITLHPITREQISRVRGLLKGSGVMEALLEDRAWERANDERKFQKWNKAASTKVK